LPEKRAWQQNTRYWAYQSHFIHYSGLGWVKTQALQTHHPGPTAIPKRNTRGAYVRLCNGHFEGTGRS
jgi:hypothetical protein